MGFEIRGCITTKWPPRDRGEINVAANTLTKEADEVANPEIRTAENVAHGYGKKP